MKFVPVMKFGPVALLSITVTTTAFAAEPAMVSKIGGRDVVWQHGGRSSLPKVQTLLSPGDRVGALEGSFLDIQYLEDSCKVHVRGGDSVVISAISPCAAAAGKTPRKDSQPAAANDGTGRPKAKVEPAATNEAAVTISSKKGSFTRMNQGNGLVDATIGADLEQGDEVFAGPNSSITLYFKIPKCEYTVQPQTVYKIEDHAPCEVPANAPKAAPGVPTAVMAGVGAVVVGGGAAAIIIGNSKHKDKPATPD